MKFKKTASHLFILLLITVGIISFARAVQSQQPELQTALAKSSAIDYDSGTKERLGSLIDFSYRLPMAHFEPLLLFVLGTVLLSIVTGINIFRARKVSFQAHSASPTSLGSRAKFRARKTSSEKNEAA